LLVAFLIISRCTDSRTSPTILVMFESKTVRKFLVLLNVGNIFGSKWFLGFSDTLLYGGRQLIDCMLM